MVLRMVKRKYKHRLEFVEDGFVACWHNALDLVKSSKLLLDNSLHAQALSLSVLALEELGKLYCIDGILYARSDGYKSDAFAKSLKSHYSKLSALELFPLFIGHLASLDPRYGTETRFCQAIAISLSELKDKGNKVLAFLKGDTFHDLDRWKQSGFYSQPRDNSFLKPNEAVDPEIAQSIYLFAWRATSTLDFLLKQGGLERYINFSRKVRSKLSEEEHETMERLGEQVFAELFPSEGDEVVQSIQ